MRKRYSNGQFRTTGNYQVFKIMMASAVACGLVVLFQPREQVWADPRSYLTVVEVEKVVEKTVEVPLDCKDEKCKILAYLVEKFQGDAADAITMIRKCENSSFEQNRTNHNKNGTTDYGVMQINSIHIPKCGEGIKNDWKANIDCGYRIYQNRGWSAWSCSHVVGVKSFWQ